MVTVASTGETIAPSSAGSIPSPSPTALEEKTGSGTSWRSMTLPAIGLTTLMSAGAPGQPAVFPSPSSPSGAVAGSGPVVCVWLSAPPAVCAPSTSSAGPALPVVSSSLTPKKKVSVKEITTARMTPMSHSATLGVSSR